MSAPQGSWDAERLCGYEGRRDEQELQHMTRHLSDLAIHVALKPKKPRSYYIGVARCLHLRSPTPPQALARTHVRFPRGARQSPACVCVAVCRMGRWDPHMAHISYGVDQDGAMHSISHCALPLVRLDSRTHTIAPHCALASQRAVVSADHAAAP